MITNDGNRRSDASPTPRPTLMPVTTENLPDGAYLASVTNIDEDSTLNLRAQPNTSADVLRRLYKNSKAGCPIRQQGRMGSRQNRRDGGLCAKRVFAGGKRFLIL